MIGTPAGASGVSANAMAAPSNAAVFACGRSRLRHQECQEQRGEGGVQPEPAGSPIRSPKSTPNAVPPTHAA